MVKVTMYDPPGGWKYGFPKPYSPSNPLEKIRDTLVRDGYREDPDFAAEHCRFWHVSEDCVDSSDTAARLAVEGCSLTPDEEAEIVADINSGRFPYLLPAPANDNKSRGPYITTYTGRFYFNDPRPEDFEIEDIAHSLAMTRRYSGHGKREYTTAEHSVHIYRWLTEQAEDADTRLAGLLHDAPEALSGFGDAASPRKKECPHIASAEFWIWKDAIAPKFGLPIEMPDAVHEADRRICADEMAQNLWEVDPNVGQPLGIELEFWDFEWAKAEFLCAFREIQRVRKQWRRVG